jgi:hypothetical protein
VIKEVYMSEWYDPEDSDIEIDRDKKEVDIYVTNNQFGSIYITLTFEQIKDIAGKL